MIRKIFLLLIVFSMSSKAFSQTIVSQPQYFLTWIKIGDSMRVPIIFIGTGDTAATKAYARSLVNGIDSASDTLKSKIISGTYNTFLNIPNSGFQHSSISVTSTGGTITPSGTPVPLGNTINLEISNTYLAQIQKGIDTIYFKNDTTVYLQRNNGQNWTLYIATKSKTDSIYFRKSGDTATYVDLPKEYSFIGLPAHGNRLSDSSGIIFRDSAGTAWRISKSNITPGTMVTWKLQNKNATFADSAVVPLPTGLILYSKGYFSSLSDFTATGFTPTLNADSSIRFTGGVNDFNQYLAITKALINNEENYTFTITGHIVGNIATTPDGISIGRLSVNTFSPQSLQVKLNYKGNTIAIYDNGTAKFTQPLNFTFASGDYFKLSVTQSGARWVMTCVDITQAITFNTSYSSNLGYVGAINIYPPNTGEWCIWNGADTTDIYSININSNSNNNALVAYAGDSKLAGTASTDRDSRAANLTASSFTNNVFAGNADRTVELIQDTSYIELFKPKYLIFNIGRNDSASGVAAAVTDSNYSNIVAWANRNNIKVVHLLPIPETSATQYGLLNFITNRFPGDQMINPATGWNNSIYLSLDGTHPNLQGNAYLSNLIIGSGFIPNDPTNFSKNYNNLPLFQPLENQRLSTINTAQLSSLGLSQAPGGQLLSITGVSNAIGIQGTNPVIFLDSTGGTREGIFAETTSGGSFVGGTRANDIMIATSRTTSVPIANDLWLANTTKGELLFITTSDANTQLRRMSINRNGTIGIGFTLASDSSAYADANMVFNTTVAGVLFPRLSTTNVNTLSGIQTHNGLLVIDTTSLFPEFRIYKNQYAAVVPVADTNQLSRLNGQTLIYNAATGRYTSATITAGANTSITNAASSITIASLPGRSDTLKAQSGAVSTISTFTPAATGLFSVGGMVNVTGGSLDVLQVQISYKDEQGNTQTISLGAGINTTLVATSLPVTTIWAQSGTAIVTKTTLTTGTGSITYDIGTYIEQKK